MQTSMGISATRTSMGNHATTTKSMEDLGIRFSTRLACWDPVVRTSRVVKVFVHLTCFHRCASSFTLLQLRWTHTLLCERKDFKFCICVCMISHARALPEDLRHRLIKKPRLCLMIAFLDFGTVGTYCELQCVLQLSESKIFTAFRRADSFVGLHVV